jgi:hypothetical protein
MENNGSQRLSKVKKTVLRQGLLAVFVLVLAVVIVVAMTTAWYNNIVHTSGLVFESASWGFDGQVQVSEAPVKAAPGDSGNIYLKVDNNSEVIVDATVNISKITMDTQMQKRLFFYADAYQVRNGEQIDRVYLNSMEGYTYTIFGNGNLTLTDVVHNDSQLKWQWVYDVLGYYVRGMVNTDGTVEIEEYLRPIEYAYDEALTTFEKTGNLALKTVDGKLTAGDFLKQFSAADGYVGTIDPATRTAAGYYQVAVDEDGYGVWAYLSTYSDILAETFWDTQLGQQAALAEKDPQIDPDTYMARLTVSGQKSNVDVQVVSTQKRLEQLLTGEENAVLRLAQDVSIDPVVVTAGKKIMLDLDGHTLTTNGAMLMDLREGSSVTVYNGALAGNGNIGFLSTGAELTLHGVTGEGMKRIVTLQDSYGQGIDSKLTMIGCNFNVQQAAVYLAGNAQLSEQMTQVVIEDCVLEGGYSGLLGNGNSENAGVDVTVINSTVKGYYTSIYFPSRDSVMTITNSYLEGITGLVVKGGHVTLISSEVKGTGQRGEPAYNANGFSDTGDGVYVEANYETEILVELYGNCKVSSAHGLAVRKYMPDATNANLIVYGGEYDTSVSEFIAESAKSTDGGYTVIMK